MHGKTVADFYTSFGYTMAGTTFLLQVNVSPVGAGAVLLQKDDVDRPVFYFAQKFNKNQLNYSTIGKEALALIQFYCLIIQHICGQENVL